MMRRVRLTMPVAEAAAGLAFVGLAAFVMREGLRLGAGWDDSGPEPGFFPFSLAVVMGIGGAAAVLQGLRTTARPFFEDRQEVVDLLRVGVPMALAIVSVSFLGFYIMSAAYIAFFAWWYGRYRWPAALASGLVAAVVLYAGLERGFRILLPRSAWYGSLLPF